MYQTHNVTTEG